MFFAVAMALARHREAAAASATMSHATNIVGSLHQHTEEREQIARAVRVFREATGEARSGGKPAETGSRRCHCRIA